VVTYILDSSAILRFTDNEAGADRVQQILDKYLDGNAHVAASALHWGEAAGRLYKLRGRDVMDKVLQRLAGMGIEVIPVTAEQAIAAALIRANHKIPYVDAFGAAIASAPQHVFITADFDLKPAAQFAKIEFLPTK
jgi:predicted nucleic acid-binding protein